MITLVIKEPGQNDRAFDHQGSMLIIGRSEDSGLVLPNVSVSRRHASIKLVGGTALLEDLLSENGIVVNGESMTKHELSPGDTFQIGRYGIVFVGLDGKALVHNGQLIDEMPRFLVQETKTVQESTYRFPPDMVKKLKASTRLSKGGVLVSEEEEARAWALGEGSVSVGGKGATIEVGGLFWGDQAAEISWTGTAHHVKKLTPWGTFKVNGQDMTERQLKEGDQVQIGKTRFRYIVQD